MEWCVVRSELLQPGSAKSMEGETKWGVYGVARQEGTLKKRSRSVQGKVDDDREKEEQVLRKTRQKSLPCTDDRQDNH